MLIRAVLFDFDGTLTEPGSLSFATIREAIGCPKGRPILEYIENLPSDDEKERARQILNRFEMEAAQRSLPNAGAEELLRYLLSKKLKIGIFSRNSSRAIHRALENFHDIRASDFDVILSRDDSQMPKPSPEAVLVAAKQISLPVEQVLVVGDFIFDIEAGHKAGARTVFLTNGASSPEWQHRPDFTIEKLWELKEIVQVLSPLPAGKLPNELLARFLGELNIHDPSLLISPSVGEDIAAVLVEGDEILVLKSDPVTFATDAISHYAVTVNVNDIATCGATPRWLLTSLLFPLGTSAAQIRQVMIEIERLSRQYGLILCGGHTEITDAVNRPVVVGQVAGTVSRSRLIDKRKMTEGDRIISTKAVAVEGTCIIAREFPAKLEALGMTRSEIERCQQFLTSPGISIVKEAQIASNSGRVTAMHDITEGGIATAIEELSAAGKHRIRVHLDEIPVWQETKKICRLLNLNPLGLIGSGSLLITCESSYSEQLAHMIREAGIEATCIGEVLGPGAGVEATSHKQKGAIAWPHFEADEIARLFHEMAGGPSRQG